MLMRNMTTKRQGKQTVPDLTPRSSTIYARAVDAVTELCTEIGRPPTLAEVADHIDSPVSDLSAIFRDESHLLEAMAENAMVLMQDQCIRSVVQADEHDPLAQFQALADAYIEWAHNYPREFRILGAMPPTRFIGNENLLRYENAVHDVMIRMLERAQENGDLSRDEDPQMLVAIAHTFGYGVASKMLIGDLARWVSGTDNLTTAKQALHVFTRRMLGRPG